MAKRRAHGEGSVYQIKDGSWRGSVQLGGGKRKYVRGDTRTEALRQMVEVRARVEQGLPATDGQLKVGAYLDKWLEDSAKPSVRPRTYDSYSSHIQHHLRPRLGHVRLADLSPGHVQRLLNDIQAAGLSANTAVRIHATLRRALNQALRWGLITRNVASLVDLPKVDHPEMQPFTPEQARAFLEAIRGDRLEALYAVAFAMGLRQGEALGLRWRDIDLDGRQLQIRYQLQRHQRGDDVVPLTPPNGLVPTKSHRSRRALVIPDTLVEKLRLHRALQNRERILAGDQWIDFDLVFASRKGSPLIGTRQSLLFQRHLEAAGLPKRRFHDMRHSCGTILAAQGVPLVEIQTILGHAEITTTMRYVHSLPESQRQAARQMDQALWGTG